MTIRLAVLMCALALLSAGASSQTPIPPVTARTAGVMQQIVTLAPVKSAMAAIERDDALTLRKSRSN